MEVLFESDNKELISFLGFNRMERKQMVWSFKLQRWRYRSHVRCLGYEELKDSDIKYEFGIDFIRDLIKQKFLIILPTWIP